jgi:hypothetical protein
MRVRVACESLREAHVFSFLWKHTLPAGAAKDSTVAARLAYLAQPSRGLYSTYASKTARMRVRSMRGVCYSFLTQLLVSFQKIVFFQRLVVASFRRRCGPQNARPPPFGSGGVSATSSHSPPPPPSTTPLEEATNPPSARFTRRKRARPIKRIGDLGMNTFSTLHSTRHRVRRCPPPNSTQISMLVIFCNISGLNQTTAINGLRDVHPHSIPGPS